MPMRIANFQFVNLFLTLPFAALLLTETLVAAEYRLEQNYSLSGRYDDNYRNLSDNSSVTDDKELSGGSISVSSTLSRGTPRSDARTSLRVTRGEFSDDSYSTTTGSFETAANLRYARGSIDVSTDASRSTQRVSVTDLDLVDSEPFRATDAFQIRGALGGQYLIGSKTQGSVNLTARSENYDADQFTDNSQRGVSASISRDFTERWGGRLSIGYSRTELNDGQSSIDLNPDLPLEGILACAQASEITDRTTDINPLLPPLACFKQFEFEDGERDSYQAILGISYRVSEKLFISLGAGPRRTESLRKSSIIDVPGAIVPESPVFSEIERNQENLTLDISASYVMEKSQLTATASTLDRVNSRGTIETQNTYEIKAIRNFTSRLAADLKFIYREFEIDTIESSSIEERENLLADFEVRYELIPGLTNVRFKYGYEEQDQFGIDRLIVENEFGVVVEHFFSRDRRNGGISLRVEYQNYDREFRFSDSDSNRQQVRVNIGWTPRLISFSR